MKLGRENLRILLVDDDEADCDLVRIALSKAGFTHPLTRLKNGAAVLEHSKNAQQTGSPLPHLILLDLNMPEMDGVRALQGLREAASFHDIPVIIVSGNDELEKRRKVAHLGIFRFIKKEPNCAHLVSALDDFLGFYNHIATSSVA